MSAMLCRSCLIVVHVPLEANPFDVKCHQCRAEQRRYTLFPLKTVKEKPMDDFQINHGDMPVLRASISRDAGDVPLTVQVGPMYQRIGIQQARDLAAWLTKAADECDTKTLTLSTHDWNLISAHLGSMHPSSAVSRFREALGK